MFKMKISVLPYAIKYYFPWLIVFKRKLYFLLKGKDLSEKRPQKANSRYCYSLWLRHLSILNENGLDVNPSIIAELGPGDSIGVGLMALLTGSKKYCALDVTKHTNLKQNAVLVDELTALLQSGTDIPNDEEFPRVNPRLKSYNFPSKIITEQRMLDQLSKERLSGLKYNLLHNEDVNEDSSAIQYFCPWSDSGVIDEGSVDMIFSQAVLEHVDDLTETYKAMHLWLKNGGVMSHQIDFKSHSTSKKWNGHWAYSDYEWKIVNGGGSHLINREPLSTHIELLNDNDFNILSVIPVKNFPSDKYNGSIHRGELAKKFKGLSNDDFSTCGAHILAIKN